MAWKYLIPRPFASALSVERPVDREPTLLAFVLMPEDADVEREPTALLVVERPVDEDVDREVTALLVVDRPVESEATPL